MDFQAGGETMSLVMGKRGDLIDSDLQVSLKWDGDLLILDLKDKQYFRSKGYSNQHSGGLAANEEKIMKWLLSR